MELPDRFREYVISNDLLPDDDQPVLLAVSGGLDSVVMAHLFRDAGRPFALAHCNFLLRGAASDGDEDFVRQLAAGWNVPFFTKRFETEQFAAQNGLSIQMAARELRYAWFEAVAGENGFTRIATAHHLNDSVETALLNFVRGTGLSGLRGIGCGPSPAGVIRPLLFATRSELEQFARDRQLEWREDASNATDEYGRNFLRHRVVPLLEELNPNFLGTAGRNLVRLRETDENQRFLLHRFFGLQEPPIPFFTLAKTKLAQLPAPRRALREFLRHYGFTEDQARQAAENLDRTGFQIFSGSGFRLLIDRTDVVIAPAKDSGREPASNDPEQPEAAVRQVMAIHADDVMVTLKDGSRLFLTPADPAHPFPDGRESVVVDADKLQFPLHLRPWKPGDAFQPFGMMGNSQKLQDFFTNIKLSRLEKENVRVLENGDGSIVWILGFRLDERFRAGAATTHFLKITRS